MKKIILLIIANCIVAIATAQQTERFTFATSVGTGIDMNEPATTPFADSRLLCYQQTLIYGYWDWTIHL